MVDISQFVPKPGQPARGGAEPGFLLLGENLMADAQAEGRLSVSGEVRVRRLSAEDLAKALQTAESLTVPVLLRAGVRYDGKTARATVTAVTPHQGRELAATVDVDPADAAGLNEALDGLLDAYAERVAAEVRKTVAQEVLTQRVNGGPVE